MYHGIAVRLSGFMYQQVEELQWEIRFLTCTREKQRILPGSVCVREGGREGGVSADASGSL